MPERVRAQIELGRFRALVDDMAGALDTETACCAIESLVQHNRFPEARTTAESLNGLVTALSDAGPDLLLQARAQLPGQAAAHLSHS